MKPRLPTDEELLLVHTPCYLASLHFGLKLSAIVEIPICCLPSWFVYHRVLKPMLRKVAINLSGGYHHASASSGGGFCVFADITLGIRHLRLSHPHITRFLVVDCDAHQGNGYARDFIGDDSVFIIDAFNPFIYPGDSVAKSRIDRVIRVDWRTSDVDYLNEVTSAVSAAIEHFQPHFIVFNAGTDIIENDPLGRCTISADGIVQRDFTVFKCANDAQLPIAMLLSGGYQKGNAAIIAQSIVNLNTHFNFC